VIRAATTSIVWRWSTVARRSWLDGRGAGRSDTTAVIEPGMCARVDGFDNILIEIETEIAA